MFQVFKARERIYEGDSCRLVADNTIQREIYVYFVYLFLKIIPCSIFILALCQNVMILLWCNVNDD